MALSQALTQGQVDSAPARNNWLSDGEGLLLRTSANGGRAWYWHHRVDGRAKRKKIGNAATMTLLEARAHVRRGGASLSLDAKCRAQEAEILVLQAKLDAAKEENDRLYRHNLSMVHAHNSMLDTLRSLGLRPEAATRMRFKDDGTVETVRL